MFLGGCPCCGPGCWYKAMDSQCSPGNPGDGWMKKADITNTGCPDCCWSFYEQYNYPNVNYIASLLYDLSVGTVLNDSLSGFVCNSNVFSGDGFVVTQNTLVFTETTRPHEIGFTEENENGSIYGGYYEGAFIAEAETNLGFGPAVFSIGFKEAVTGRVYNGASIYTSSIAETRPYLTIPLGTPAFENRHLYRVVFRDNTGVHSDLASAVDYDPNTGAPLEEIVVNSRSFGGYEWEGVCTSRDIEFFYGSPYLWQNQSHLLAELDDTNSNLFQVYRGIGSQTISNENWNASNQTLSESVSYYSLEDGSETRSFDFSFSWPDLTSVFTRRRASYCGEPDSPLVRKELTCVSNDFCKDGTIYDSFEAAVYGEYLRQCYYTDYEYACEKIDDKPDDMQYQVCGNYEPIDCPSCFSECPEATGYKMAKELTDNPPEDGDSFFGSVTYNNEKINVTWNGSISRPMYESTEGVPPTNAPAFRAELTRSFRSVSLNGYFLSRIEDPNQAWGSLIGTSYRLSGRSVIVSQGGATGVFDAELAVSFAGKNITASDTGGTGTSACFLVPCQSESCNVSEPIQQEDFKGPLTITYKGKQRQAFGSVMDFEFSYEIEVPDSFYQSHCWLCPDEPKPTIPIDYDVLGLEPVFTPNLGGRTMPTTTTGPGTHLKNMLAAWGIHAKKGGGCKCRDWEVKMNRWGSDCSQHVDAIVDHLQAEAKKRNLPFVRKAGEMLVKRAIKRFEKES